MPEVFAGDPVKRQHDQPGDRLVAAPGAGQREGEERHDRVMPGKLLVRAAQRRDRLLEAPEVAQGAAVLDQALAQVVAVEAVPEGLLVDGRGCRLPARVIERARVREQRPRVAGMPLEQVPEVTDRGLGSSRRAAAHPASIASLSADITAVLSIRPAGVTRRAGAGRGG